MTSSYTDLQDYTYYFVPAPWLSVKLLRLMQMYGPPDDPAVRGRLNECLETILNKAQVRRIVDWNTCRPSFLKIGGALLIPLLSLLSSIFTRLYKTEVFQVALRSSVNRATEMWIRRALEPLSSSNVKIKFARRGVLWFNWHWYCVPKRECVWLPILPKKSVPLDNGWEEERRRQLKPEGLRLTFVIALDRKG